MSIFSNIFGWFTRIFSGRTEIVLDYMDAAIAIVKVLDENKEMKKENKREIAVKQISGIIKETNVATHSVNLLVELAVASIRE